LSKRHHDNYEMSTRERILKVLSHTSNDFEVFELLEKFADVAQSKNDVMLLVDFLERNQNPIVRHEAAAQLLELARDKPMLMKRVKQKVLEALMKRASDDANVTSRHEAIEVLGYLGDEKAIPVLRPNLNHENEDIRYTARIALDVLQFRLDRKLNASELWKAIVDGRHLGT